jgi:aspartokinase/homoserine dehydrogenase 1
MSKTITMKFGGTSVGSVDAIRNVITIIKREVDAGNRVAIVISAMSKVTDSLIKSVQVASEGDKWGYMSLSRDLRDRHEDTINQLMAACAERDKVLLAVNKLLDSHLELCNAINILGEATPRINDAVVSFGERLSVQMLAAVLAHHGINARPIDAGQIIRTDENYSNAQPYWDETETNIKHGVSPLLDEGTVPVITGFIGMAYNGNYTTLGRGGSDYSAAIFASFLESDEFVIWTDVDGVMTTDPRVDSRARVLPYVSYQEVGELAFYGAKVLHPKTVQPIINRGIPMWVRNTFNPNYPGTKIGHESRESHTVIKAVTSIRNVSMLTVSGKGMLGVPGIAGRTFLSASQAQANILMISQSSSEQSFCFTVMDSVAQTVKVAVEQELRQEILRQNVDGIEIQDDIVIITVVGAGMRGIPGVAGRIFTTMGDSRINVLAIAQGSSECSISFVVAEDDAERAVRTLHDLALEPVPVQ